MYKSKANGEAYEAMESDQMPNCMSPEEQEFRTGYLGFPRKRRPDEYRRDLAATGGPRGKELMEKCPKL